MKETRSATAIEPVHKELHLACPPARAFRLFTEHVAAWWPLDTHSLCPGRSTGCWFEPRAGGELYELGPNGERYVWGTVLAWEPPDEVRFTFHPGGDAATAGTVSVRFEARQGGCRVTLEHTGWELLGDAALRHRGNYDSGWQEVFNQGFGEWAATRLEATP